MKILKIGFRKEYLLIPDLIWDGFSAYPEKHQAVWVSNGLIKQIIPADYAEKLPETESIYLPGLFLMPGLADCHVHFSMNCTNLFQAIEDWRQRPVEVMDLAREAAADYLANGILAVRDGGDKMNIGLGMKHCIDKGEFSGPLVIATGQAIFRKGKYGNFLGPGVESVEDALAQVELLKGTGIDQLKVVVSGIVSFKDYGIVGPVQFSTAELTEIVAKAHYLGLKVMAHASSAAAVETAVKSGVDSVEHGYFLETPHLEMMAEKNTAWVPTLAPLGNIVTSGQAPYQGADLEVIKKSFELQLQRVNEAYRLDVNLGIGTDAGANQVWHGYSYHQELEYFAMAGLDNAAIIRLATAGSAQIIGCEKLGCMAAGYKPYLIGLTGNPFESLSHLKSPEIVIIPEPA